MGGGEPCTISFKIRGEVIGAQQCTSRDGAKNAIILFDERHRIKTNKILLLKVELLFFKVLIQLNVDILVKSEAFL